MSARKWWPIGRTKKKPNKVQADEYVSTSLVKIQTPVTELKVGMYVVELDRSWLDSPFLFQGFELKSEADIQQVRDVCEYVYVDATKTKTVTRSAGTVKKDALLPNSFRFGTPPHKISELKTEITRAEKIYTSSATMVADFMDRIAQGGGVDSKLARMAVSECVNSVLHSPDAMLWLSQLKKKDEYTSQHSLNVCVLSIVLGRHLNVPVSGLNILGLCGLMHDMGKMLVPLQILNKPGLLEPEEMAVMRSHAELGYQLLQSSDGMHPNAIDVAYTHHENLNGKGYPRRLNQSVISMPTRIVTIADIYDAITSDRVYQKGRTHLEAISIMSNLAGNQLDSALVYKFIESIGVYPPGCLVELTNGAIAIVVEVNETLKLRPKIMMILDEEKNPAPEHILDLSKMIEDKNGEIYTIKGIVKAEDWNIDSTKYYREGVLQKGFAHTVKA